MNKPITLTITEKDYNYLYKHLFSGDDDEHGAVLAVGVSTMSNGARLLVRKVFLAEDGVEYVPGQRGYRALTAQFVAEVSDYCVENNLGYLAVHCHFGKHEVSFSEDDFASHRRGYPALLQLVGEPVGALVFAKHAVAGEIWTNQAIWQLESMKVIGSKIRSLYPSLHLSNNIISNPTYDRHARLFGDIGQSILSNLKVGIIGLGGGGSLVNEWVSRLGVGKIIAIDFDRVEPSNLPRIVGSSNWDALSCFAKSRLTLFQKFAKAFSKHKVKVARRIAKTANPNIRYKAIVGDVQDEKVALQLKDVDFIFLATDNIASRNVFNSLLHQYLIPGAQIGAKVRANKDTKDIIEIFTTGRMVLPYKSGGCLYCNGWIPPSRLQQELLTEEEKKEQNYIDGETIHEPSVITLNVLSASQVINDFMMMFTCLYSENIELPHLLNDVLIRELNIMDFQVEEDCLHCGTVKKSNLAKGDRGELPCIQSK